MAKLLDAPPSSFTAQQLSQLAHMPPFDEHLVLTPNYLVYKTDYELLGALKKAFTSGASAMGPFWAGPMMKTLMSWVDTEDRSFWLPNQSIQGIEPQMFHGDVASLFGTRRLTCYGYEVSIGGGCLWFLQMGTGEGNAEKQFYRMIASLDGLLSAGRGRSA
jgi:hypothetical protein